MSDKIIFIEKEIDHWLIKKKLYEQNIKDKVGHIESMKYIIEHIDERLDYLIKMKLSIKN